MLLWRPGAGRKVAAGVGAAPFHPAGRGFTPRRKPREKPRPPEDIAYDTAFAAARIGVFVLGAILVLVRARWSTSEAIVAHALYDLVLFLGGAFGPG